MLEDDAQTQLNHFFNSSIVFEIDETFIMAMSFVASLLGVTTAIARASMLSFRSMGIQAHIVVVQMIISNMKIGINEK